MSFENVKRIIEVGVTRQAKPKTVKMKPGKPAPKVDTATKVNLSEKPKLAKHANFHRTLSGTRKY